VRVPRPVDAAWLESKLSARLWIGLLLLSISLVSFIGVQRWMASRTFVAVDMRISPAPGHIMAGRFNINLKNWYQIEIILVRLHSSIRSVTRMIVSRPNGHFTEMDK
jgi:hypothetical protein